MLWLFANAIPLQVTIAKTQTSSSYSERGEKLRDNDTLIAYGVGSFADE